MPDVGDLEAWHQFECFRPVGAGVAGNRRLGVAGSSVFHIAGLSRPAAVQAGAIAPLGVELDTVRRICNHQQGLAIAQQSCNILRVG